MQGHTDPDSTHDPATQVGKESIAFFPKRAKAVNLGRQRHLILTLMVAKLVGADKTATEKVDGVIFFHIHTTPMDRCVSCLEGLSGDSRQGAGGAIEGEEEVIWFQ